jgi:hypothetical protein
MCHVTFWRPSDDKTWKQILKCAACGTREASFSHGSPPRCSSPLQSRLISEPLEDQKKKIGGPLGKAHCRLDRFVSPMLSLPNRIASFSRAIQLENCDFQTKSGDRRHFRDRKRPEAHNPTREALQKLTLTSNSPYPTCFLFQQTPVLKTFPILWAQLNTGISRDHKGHH